MLILWGIIAGTAASGLMSPPAFLSSHPGTGLSTKLVLITNLSGTGFQPGAAVKLTRAGFPDIVATDVIVVSESRIICKIDLAGAPAGVRDIVVTNPDGGSGTLRDGFTVLNMDSPATAPSPPAPGIFATPGRWGLSFGVTDFTGTGPRPSAVQTLTRTGAPDSISGNGTLSPIGVTTVNYGGCQTYTITPDTGYHVTDVIVNGESVGAVTSYTFKNVHANHTIRALFGIDTYTITPSAGYGGSISLSGPVTVDYGSTVVVTITPDAGYHIASVVIDGVSQGAATGYQFTSIRANHTVAASFAINRFTMTAAAGSGGTIEPSGAVQVMHSSSPVFTIVPDPGYHIATVTVDGSPAGTLPRYTFPDVQANHAISTTFAPNPAVSAISPNSGKNGKIILFTITGTGFPATGTPHVALYYPGTSTVFVEGDAIVVASSAHGSTRVTGQFSLPVSPPHRFYDVKVTSPDGSSALVPHGFLVT
jgi:hypothetical protein